MPLLSLLRHTCLKRALEEIDEQISTDINSKMVDQDKMACAHMPAEQSLNRIVSLSVCQLISHSIHFLLMRPPFCSSQNEKCIVPKGLQRGIRGLPFVGCDVLSFLFSELCCVLVSMFGTNPIMCVVDRRFVRRTAFLHRVIDAISDSAHAKIMFENICVAGTALSCGSGINNTIDTNDSIPSFWFASFRPFFQFFRLCLHLLRYIWTVCALRHRERAVALLQDHVDQC